jgi:hypothetical protein
MARHKSQLGHLMDLIREFSLECPLGEFSTASLKLFLFNTGRARWLRTMPLFLPTNLPSRPAFLLVPFAPDSSDQVTDEADRRTRSDRPTPA